MLVCTNGVDRWWLSVVHRIWLCPPGIPGNLWHAKHQCSLLHSFPRCSGQQVRYIWHLRMDIRSVEGGEWMNCCWYRRKWRVMGCYKLSLILLLSKMIWFWWVGQHGMVFNCINPALKRLPFLPEDCLNFWAGPLCDSLAAWGGRGVCVWAVGVMDALEQLFAPAQQLGSTRGWQHAGCVQLGRFMGLAMVVVLGNIRFSVEVLGGCLSCAWLAGCVWEWCVPCVWAPKCWTDSLGYAVYSQTFHLGNPSQQTGVWASTHVCLSLRCGFYFMVISFTKNIH